MASLKKALTGNIKTKLMALFMAGALWTYAYFFSLRTDEGIFIPFEISAPEGWSVMEQNTEYIIVSLQYPKHAEAKVREAIEKGELRAIYSVEIEPEEPLRSFANIRLSEENFRFPQDTDVNIRSYEPRLVDFTLAKLSTRRVPVELRLSEPPPGYNIRGWWWNPRSVTITGPESVIRNVDAVQTEEIQVVAPPVDTERLPAGRIDVNTRIEVDGKVYNISCDERIEYIIYLTKKSGERELAERVKIRILQYVSTGYKVSLPRLQDMKVILRGPDELLERVKAEDVVLYVDVEGLQPADTPYMQTVNAFVTGFTNAEQIEVIPEERRVPVFISQ